jgi:hypothetical protein
MEKPIQKKQKILRRPMIACQTTEFGVGLLRMTSFVPFPSLNLTLMGEGRRNENPPGKKAAGARTATGDPTAGIFIW